MKQNTWKKWNLGKVINIGSTGSLPIIFLYSIIATWFVIISLIIWTLITSTR